MGTYMKGNEIVIANTTFADRTGRSCCIPNDFYRIWDYSCFHDNLALIYMVNVTLKQYFKILFFVYYTTPVFETWRLIELLFHT